MIKLFPRCCEGYYLSHTTHELVHNSIEKVRLVIYVDLETTAIFLHNIRQEKFNDVYFRLDTV